MLFENGKKIKIIYNRKCEWCLGSIKDCEIHDGEIRIIDNFKIISPDDKINASFYDTEGIYWRGQCCKLLNNNKTLMETE